MNESKMPLLNDDPADPAQMHQLTSLITSHGSNNV